MGVNNRKRRAATAAYGAVERQVLGTMSLLVERKVDEAELRAIAEALRRRVQSHPRQVLQAVVADVLDRIAATATEGGWGPGDLVELVRRCAGESFLPTLDSLLDGSRPRIDTDEGLAALLGVGALLSSVPLLEVGDLLDATVSGDGGEEHPKLAQVRALLAKAESTDYDEEAQALSAKAQELISKYALDRFVAHGRGHQGRAGLQVRRLWLDPPYVAAKASLVHHVARANRCRAASADRFGFCILVGASADLHGVELLVTSLLVQADTAMLRHGRRLDGLGTSRTRSFRRSFLFAYAGRIGERLREAAETVATSRGTDLLPVLRSHEERVEEAFGAALPHTVRKQSTFSNWEGWAAGVAAADLAQLDVNGKLRARAG